MTTIQGKISSFLKEANKKTEENGPLVAAAIAGLVLIGLGTLAILNYHSGTKALQIAKLTLGILSFPLGLQIVIIGVQRLAFNSLQKTPPHEGRGNTQYIEINNSKE